MKDKLNQILIRYRPQLVDEIDCTELLNLLISRNILTRRQAKSISVSFMYTNSSIPYTVGIVCTRFRLISVLQFRPCFGTAVSMLATCC